MTALSADIERFRSAIEAHFGLVFDDNRLSLLGDILDSRCEARGCSRADEYIGRFLENSQHSDEESILAERLTVGETYFFRLEAHFRVLTEVLVPTRLEQRPPERILRVLSAGCSSGEEAYSIAIALRERLSSLAGWNIRIAAFDINPVALRKAAIGCYSPWSLRETPERLRETYFRPEGASTFRIDDSIRGMVTFEQRNLEDESSAAWPAPFDAIFCRNVLMYLSPRAAREAVERLARCMAPQGLLFLGTAETLRGVSNTFDLRHTHGTFYYQLRGDGPRIAASSPSGSRPARPWEPSPALPGPGSGSPGDAWMASIQEAAERIDALARGPRAAAAPPGPGAAPIVPFAAVATARRLLQQERFTEALDLLAAVPDEGPADVDALLLRAVLLTNTDRRDDAEAACLEVLRRDCLNAGAHYVLALCRERAGDRAAAIDHDQYALYLDPGFSMPRLHLGLAASRDGQRETARRELGDALVLLEREDASRILLFGGGFTREALIEMCQAQLRICGGHA